MLTKQDTDTFLDALKWWATLSRAERIRRENVWSDGTGRAIRWHSFGKKLMCLYETYKIEIGGIT